MLLLADYERITQTIKSILDSEGAATAHSCQFFAMMGAAILYTHYHIPARPMFGAAFLLLDEASRDILSYGRFEGDSARSDPDHYHAWVDTQEYVIDFMAPLYQDAMRSKGYKKDVPRWMLQRHKSTIADSPFSLRRKGDCHFQENSTLSKHMVNYYLNEAMYRDLIEISTQWFRKPPEIMRSLETRSLKNVVRRTHLDQLAVTGTWK